MTKKPVLLQFDEHLLSKLDRFADEVERSRSAIVRDAVARYIKQESEAEKDRRLIEGYTKMPDTNEFEGWADESAREMVEEEPW